VHEYLLKAAGRKDGSGQGSNAGDGSSG
jgi:hypothetical protein